MFQRNPDDKSRPRNTSQISAFSKSIKSVKNKGNWGTEGNDERVAHFGVTKRGTSFKAGVDKLVNSREDKENQRFGNLGNREEKNKFSPKSFGNHKNGNGGKIKK